MRNLSIYPSFLMVALILVGCDGCDEDELFPGQWDSNAIWRCMIDESLPVDTVNQRLLGTWAEGHITVVSPDSLGPFIDTLVFEVNNQLLISYQYGYEIRTGYELTTDVSQERANLRIRLDTIVPSLPINNIFYCDDRLYFNGDFIRPDPDDFEYGFNRVE